MKPLLRLLLASLLAAALLPLASAAQTLAPRHLETTAAAPAEEPRPIHITDALLRQQATVEAIRRWEQFGPPARAKTVRAYALGDTAFFKVRDLTSEADDGPTFLTVAFVLRREAEPFRLWVEVGETDQGHVRESDLDALFAALAQRTPLGSINPDAGIIVNNEAIFGEPPVVDGDPKVDVLLTDVRDDFAPGSGYVAGYVDPLDVFTSEANNRAILYLDTYPGLFTPAGTFRDTQGLEETAAHEYQHLIHLRYDPREITFVNEGLSEWASLINGYTPRAITYIRNPASYNVPLFRWSVGLTARVLEDYQRAGLLTAYIAEQIGAEATGSITRTPQRGFDAYASVLGDFGLDVETVVVNFHTANLLNDVETFTGLGYLQEYYRTIRAEPVVVPPLGAPQDTMDVRLAVESGGVVYHRFRDVEDFSLLIDIVVDDESDASSLLARRARVMVRALLYRGGEVTVETFRPSLDRRTFAGAYDQIDLVIVNDDPRPAEIEEPNGVHLFYQAGWTRDGSTATTEVIYDSGEVAVSENEVGQQQAEFYSLGGEAIVVTAFPVPEGGVLTHVSVAPFYEGQFQNANLPSDAPTDFRLHVWAGADPGLLGEELLRLEVVDPRLNAGLALNFLNVDLTPYAGTLSNLTDTVYVGLSNAGGDENYIVLGVSPYEGESVSYLSLPQFAEDGQRRFVPFDELRVGGEPLLADRVYPIRATFTVMQEVASEAAPEIPDRLTLAPNFPNPFNPSTTIRFALPSAADVRLTVYDALGREHAVLVDGRRDAGSHEVVVDAATWPSGTYFYTLASGGRRLARTMVLVK